MSNFSNINCSAYIDGLSTSNDLPGSIPNECLRYNPAIEQMLIVLFAILIIGTLGGNCLVIAAIFLVKRLQIPSNFLILSLAASDTLVAFILPLVAFIQLHGGYWPFSETLCDIFICLDVLLCSSSILNLCAISIDRFLIITKPLEYGTRRTVKQMLVMIMLVWFLSGLISIPPAIGWKQKFIPGKCIYSENLGYQIFATCGSFYIPLIIMLILYGRIFLLTRSMIKKDAELNRATSRYSSPMIKSFGENDRSFIKENAFHSLTLSSPKRKKVGLRTHGTKEDKSLYAENKAITTLGVIMGCFTICWLPFFVIQLFKPVLKVANIDSNLYISQWIQDMFLWLGYINSFLNPIIYAKFNREFRTPFKLILFCKCFHINSAIRSEMYALQYGPKIQSSTSRRQNMKHNLYAQTEIKYRKYDELGNLTVKTV